MSVGRAVVPESESYFESGGAGKSGDIHQEIVRNILSLKALRRELVS